MDFDGENERWIPYHMIEVLKGFYKLEPQAPLAPHIGRIIKQIAESMEDALTVAKSGGGDIWEKLFEAVLLIRLQSSNFHPVMLPLAKEFNNCAVYFNDHLASELYLINNVDSLMDMIKTPPILPAVTVYTPTHANFVGYDLIVAAFHADNRKQLFGYQLKTGKRTPGKTKQKAKNQPNSNLTKSFWIRGHPSSTTINRDDGWIIPNEDELTSFFGLSGRNWIPHRWNEKLRSVLLKS